LVTPAGIAGQTCYPHERCTRRPGGLQATGRTMRRDCQRVFCPYRGRSTQGARVGLFAARSQAAQARTIRISTRSPSNRSAQSTCGLVDHKRQNDDVACALLSGASSWGTQPSQPRASAHSRAPRGVLAANVTAAVRACSPRPSCSAMARRTRQLSAALLRNKAGMAGSGASVQLSAHL
jgi:hypothetical protein